MRPRSGLTAPYLLRAFDVATHFKSFSCLSLDYSRTHTAAPSTIKLHGKSPSFHLPLTSALCTVSFLPFPAQAASCPFPCRRRVQKQAVHLDRRSLFLASLCISHFPRCHFMRRVHLRVWVASHHVLSWICASDSTVFCVEVPRISFDHKYRLR